MWYIQNLRTFYYGTQLNVYHPFRNLLLLRSEYGYLAHCPRGIRPQLLFSTLQTPVPLQTFPTGHRLGMLLITAWEAERRVSTGTEGTCSFLLTLETFSVAGQCTYTFLMSGHTHDRVFDWHTNTKIRWGCSCMPKNSSQLSPKDGGIIILVYL